MLAVWLVPSMVLTLLVLRVLWSGIVNTAWSASFAFSICWSVWVSIIGTHPEPDLGVWKYSFDHCCQHRSTADASWAECVADLWKDHTASRRPTFQPLSNKSNWTKGELVRFCGMRPSSFAPHWKLLGSASTFKADTVRWYESYCIEIIALYRFLLLSANCHEFVRKIVKILLCFLHGLYLVLYTDFNLKLENTA